MESYSTDTLPIHGRAAAWNALYASRMSQVEFTPADRNKFDAELRIGHLGPMRLARLTVDKCSAERAPRHASNPGPRLYNFLLQAKGSSTFYHCGNESHLQEGDLVLVDTALPHYFRTQNVSLTIMARVQSDLLREYLPSPEQFCGVDRQDRRRHRHRRGHDDFACRHFAKRRGRGLRGQDCALSA